VKGREGVEGCQWEGTVTEYVLGIEVGADRMRKTLVLFYPLR
jgi:hypothetical protein